MINVALLSKWHVHAEDYARQAEENPNLSIQMVWDEDPVRGKQWANALGVPFEEDLNAVLSNPDIDAVIVNTPTNRHKDVILAAAENKKHIFTEKVLAFTVEDCKEIFSTIESNGVKLMLSLPRLTEDYYLYAQEAIDKGWLGKLTMIRCRLAHNGAVPPKGHSNGWLPEHFFNKEQCGGGALIDLGAHPIYLTNRLAGPATAVTARMQSTLTHEVDDNAIVLVDYESGAMGAIEASFVSSGSPFQLELYGTEGALLIEDETIRIKSSHFNDKGWVVPESLPSPLPMAINQWVEAISNNVASSITKEDMLNLTLINEAAALSVQKNTTVRLSDMK
ncbi:putative dehydrogenase [Scopulibacillus darangshiensis]|uniref:Putative dehydrogenase n=1 Tax=Scopulibacillus darangshiensis TaxID=442528 RepID=A0A4R2NU34_9BACL|nr:Gfo/Idh/MocA family oxidoreductase [Scopulibacillus darangshiensis]TCP25589.1 putative dehydrogenase [Scopulibacillus darangshiensis]